MPDARWSGMDGLLESSSEEARPESGLPLDDSRSRGSSDDCENEEPAGLLSLDVRPSSAFLGGLDRPDRDLSRDGWGDLAAGERLGPFRLLRLLGEGGMGAVYEAEQDQPRRRVALKVLRSGAHGSTLSARFRREADVLARLVHPGIAQVHEVGAAVVEGGRRVPYFAMELVAGRPLDQHVRTTVASHRETLDLVAELCDIVQFAHDRGIIHRDLKPANVMVCDAPTAARPTDRPSPHAVPARVKVLDFGVARVTSADGDLGAGPSPGTLHTAPGQLLGTVPYMSPEQIACDHTTLDGRSDVYAIGVILYQLLAGRLPHEVRWNELSESMRAIREDPPPRLGDLRRALAGDIETIVCRAMEKERTRRYTSPAELAADIRRHLRGEPILARPPSVRRRLTAFARRHWILSAGLMAFLAMWLAASCIVVFFAVRAGHARARAERRFEIARELGDLVLFDVVDRLGNLPGAQAVKLRVLEQAAPLYEQLAAEHPERLSQRREIWLNLGAIGQAQSVLGAFEPGRRRFAAAERLMREALAELPQESPERGQMLEDLAWNCSRLALLEHRAGDLATSLDRFLEAERLFERVIAIGPATHGTVARRLSHVLRRHGDALIDAGSLDAAEHAYRRSLAIETSLGSGFLPSGSSPPEGNPSFEDRLNLTRTWRRLGRLEWTRGRLDAARSWLEPAVSLRETLVTERPNDFDAVHDLSVATEELARVHLDSEAIDLAVLLARRSAELAERLSQLEPEAVMCRHQQAKSWCTLAVSLARSAGATRTPGSRVIGPSEQRWHSGQEGSHRRRISPWRPRWSSRAGKPCWSSSVAPVSSPTLGEHDTRRSALHPTADSTTLIQRDPSASVLRCGAFRGAQ